MAEPTNDHSECRDLVAMWATAAPELVDGQQCDVTVVEPANPLQTCRCPHGVRYWIVPTEAAS